MNQYEVTIITKENLKGEPAKKEIVSLGGKVLDIAEAEERRFAYPIKKEGSGYYTNLRFEIAPEKVLELNKKLGLDSEVLRHLIITYKAAKVTPPKALEVKTEAKEIERVAVPEIKEVTAPTQEVTVLKEESAPDVLEEKSSPVRKAKKAKEVTKEEEPTKEIEKPAERSKETEEAIKQELSSEDRLKALDKKLDELLKE